MVPCSIMGEAAGLCTVANTRWRAAPGGRRARARRSALAATARGGDDRRWQRVCAAHGRAGAMAVGPFPDTSASNASTSAPAHDGTAGSGVGTTGSGPDADARRRSRHLEAPRSARLRRRPTCGAVLPHALGSNADDQEQQPAARAGIEVSGISWRAMTRTPCHAGNGPVKSLLHRARRPRHPGKRPRPRRFHRLFTKRSSRDIAPRYLSPRPRAPTAYAKQRGETTTGRASSTERGLAPCWQTDLLASGVHHRSRPRP